MEKKKSLLPEPADLRSQSLSFALTTFQLFSFSFFFYNVSIYLLTFGHARSFIAVRGLSLVVESGGGYSSFSAQSSHGSGSSSCGAQASAAVEHRLQQLWSMGSVVAAHGL